MISYWSRALNPDELPSGRKHGLRVDGQQDQLDLVVSGAIALGKPVEG